VHNFLYVYSPNGPIATDADYLARYPGDAFIDVPGIDMYHEKPQKKDNWMENFGKTLDAVQAFAQRHHKVTTVPEAAGADEHSEGANGLDFHYSIVKGGLAGIVKSMGVNWGGYNAVSFYLKPDGKGQRFIIQMNSDGEDFEVNLTSLVKTTKPQRVVLPFSKFIGKNGGKFHPERLQHFAIYCNTVGDNAVDSHFYLDDIHAVKQ